MLWAAPLHRNLMNPSQDSCVENSLKNCSTVLWARLFRAFLPAIPNASAFVLHFQLYIKPRKCLAASFGVPEGWVTLDTPASPAKESVSILSPSRLSDPRQGATRRMPQNKNGNTH